MSHITAYLAFCVDMCSLCSIFNATFDDLDDIKCPSQPKLFYDFDHHFLSQLVFPGSVISHCHKKRLVQHEQKNFILDPEDFKPGLSLHIKLVYVILCLGMDFRSCSSHRMLMNAMVFPFKTMRFLHLSFWEVLWAMYSSWLWKARRGFTIHKMRNV